MTKLQHELALVGSLRVLEIFGSLLRPEEHLDAHTEIYSVVIAILQNYDDEHGAAKRPNCDPGPN